jgi:hypothetical protein
MSVILLLLGVLLSAAGGASIGFGIPIKESNLGTTFILAGVFALVGGLLLIGLSAVVAQLARIAAALKVAQAQAATAARLVRAEPPPLPTETIAREPAKETTAKETKDVPKEREEPAKEVELPPAIPAAAIPTAASPAVEESAIERLRSTIPRQDKVVPEAADPVPLSPNGQQTAHVVHHLEPARPEPVPRSAVAAGVEAREPRLDFLFPARQTRPAPQQEAFDTVWPKPPAHEGHGDRRLEVARAPAAAGVVPAPVHAEAPAPAAAPSKERTVAILKSGVVDGMAYTLYADGSIEAQLPQGTVRFGSIAELRAHIESNG